MAEEAKKFVIEEIVKTSEKVNQMTENLKCRDM